MSCSNHKLVSLNILKDQKKIIYQNVSRYYKFAYDDKGFYLDMNLFFIPGSDLYLLGILSSKCIQYFAHKLTDTIPGGFLVMKTMYVKKYPIPFSSEKQKEAVANIIKYLIRKDLGDAKKLELKNNLDRLIYQIFELNEYEIQIIEEAITK